MLLLYYKLGKRVGDILKYYFIINRKDELLSKHSMKEYADFLEISLAFFCQILNGKRHTTKHMAYAISKYGGNKNVGYYFEKEE